MKVVAFTMAFMISQVMAFWLKFDKQIACVCKHILWVKYTAVATSRTAELVPPGLVEVNEIVTPSFLKRISVLIPVVEFYVIKAEVPGHVFREEVRSPGMIECRSPKVHSQVLLSMHKFDSFVVRSVNFANLTVIFEPSNVLWCPFK